MVDRKSSPSPSQDYLQYKRNNARNDQVHANNPCAKENAISMKCLDRNGYVKDKCEKEFENYKQCKKFWYYVAQDRAQKGLPLKMTAEERQQAKADFVKEIDERAKELEMRRKKQKPMNRQQ